jgi:hypothetical protein
MPEHDLKMDKKADIKIPTETLIGIIIFVVVLLGIFVPLFIGAYNFFFGSKVSELSINNFERLSSEIGNVINADGDVNSSIVVSFDDTVRVVGFGYDCDKDYDPDCPSMNGVYLLKSKKCGINEACFCYYDSKDKKFEKALGCVAYAKNAVFSMDGSKEFTVYFESKKLLIEKTESNGIVTVKFSVV